MMIKNNKFEKFVVFVCVSFLILCVIRCKREDLNAISSSGQKQKNREEDKFRIYHTALAEMLNLKSVDEDFIRDVFQTKEINALIRQLSQFMEDDSMSEYERAVRVARIIEDLGTGVPVFRLREFPTKELWNNRKDVKSRIREFYISKFNWKTGRFNRFKYNDKSPSVEEMSIKYNELVNKVIDDPNYARIDFQREFERWLREKNEGLAVTLVYDADPAWIPTEISLTRGLVTKGPWESPEIVQDFIRKIREMQRNSNPATLVLSQKLIAEIDFSTVVPDSLVVSRDSKRVACVVQADGSYLAVVDGKEGKKYDSIAALIFSSNSKRLAYVAESEGNQFVVVDGKENKKYNAVSAVTFSPDSERVSYVAESDGQQFVVVDAKQEKKYADIVALTFSPDSEQIAYLAGAEVFGDKCVVVLDGKESKQYDGIARQPPSLRTKPCLCFSPDGRHLAYGARVGNKMFVVLDSEEQEKYDGVSPPVFSPDGKRLAYAAKVGDSWCVVVDGKADKQYDGLGEEDPLFSPDSKRLAYTARVSTRRLVVLDGTEQGIYDSVGGLTFSPNSNRLAYVAQRGSDQFVVVDAKEYRRYSTIGQASFSPDSRHLVYIAVTGKKHLVVVDRKDATEYEVILPQSRIIFDSPETFHFLVIKDSAIYLVHETINR